MAEERINESEMTRETGSEIEETENGKKTEPSGGSVFEGIYEKLPDISVEAVNRFIVICVIAFVAVILVGVLKANHVF